MYDTEVEHVMSQVRANRRHAFLLYCIFKRQIILMPFSNEQQDCCYKDRYLEVFAVENIFDLSKTKLY